MNEDGDPTDGLDRLALSILQELGSSATTVQEAAGDPMVLDYIQRGMQDANEESVSRAAKVQASVVVHPG